eukprot:g8686.t1
MFGKFGKQAAAKGAQVGKAIAKGAAKAAAIIQNEHQPPVATPPNIRGCDLAYICSARQAPQLLSRLIEKLADLDAEMLPRVEERCRTILGRVAASRKKGIDKKLLTSMDDVIQVVEDAVQETLLEERERLSPGGGPMPEDEQLRLQREALLLVVAAIIDTLMMKQFTTMPWSCIKEWRAWVKIQTKYVNLSDTLLTLKATCVDTDLSAHDALTNVFGTDFIQSERPIAGVRGVSPAWELWTALKTVLRAADDKDKAERNGTAVARWWMLNDGADADPNEFTNEFFAQIDLRDVIYAYFADARTRNE